MAEGSFQCAGCGKSNETFVDESAGQHQSYVEDCQVCCRPIEFGIERDEDGALLAVSVRRLD